MILIENRTKSLGAGYNASPLHRFTASPLRLINLSLAAGLIFAPFTAHSAFANVLDGQSVKWNGTLGKPPPPPACVIRIMRPGTLGFDVSKGKVDSFSQDFTDGGAAGVNPRVQVINNLKKAGGELDVFFTAPSFLRDGTDVSNEFSLQVGIGSKPDDDDEEASLAGASPVAGTGTPKASMTLVPGFDFSSSEVWLQGTYKGTESAMPPGKYSAKSTFTCEPADAGGDAKPETQSTGGPVVSR